MAASGSGCRARTRAEISSKSPRCAAAGAKSHNGVTTREPTNRRVGSYADRPTSLRRKHANPIYIYIYITRMAYYYDILYACCTRAAIRNRTVNLHS